MDSPDVNHNRDAGRLETQTVTLLAAGFACARLMALLAMPLEGLRGYGDYIHFFTMFSLPGWPFFDYWVEFPPLFSFLSALLARAAGGQEHVYDYLLFFLITLADTGSLVFFFALARRLHPERSAWLRVGAYLLLLLSLAYAWWYFDAFAVFFLLLGLNLFLEGKTVRAGAALAAGILTKFFPGLALIAAWRRRSLDDFARLAVASLLPVALVWGALGWASPSYTAASLLSQGSKGSWETVWALMDGNYRTGNFGPEEERLDVSAAYRPMGNPPVVPPWASLLVFGGLGLVGLAYACPRDDRQSLALVGFGWCLFLLWSPGWSPQWVLYLLPLLLLTLVERQADLSSQCN